MSYYYPFCKKINLHVTGRITESDAYRQMITAIEILKRLSSKPGVILADEVGMGKTFVALAVAVSVALENKGKRPVVVMVPPSLKEKWPRDFELFKERCLPKELAAKIKSATAENAVGFLKLLDDPPRRRKSIVFLTHGAMYRNLNDKWVFLALIYQAIKGRRGADHSLRKPLSRVLGKLLHMQWVEKNGQEIWMVLLKTHPSEWLGVLEKWGIDPENDNDPETDDDPVPQAVWEILPKINTDAIFNCLTQIPKRNSQNFDTRVRDVQKSLRHEIKGLWGLCISKMKLNLPLLILDEAHHLKNAQTQLASLFQSEDAKNDAEEITRGRLAGIFRRMLFLTATPFQLGHSELCSVLDRFSGISWKKRHAPPCGEMGFSTQMQVLRDALDKAQLSAETLDSAWGRLKQEDLECDGIVNADVENWWETTRTSTQTMQPKAEQILHCYESTKGAMTAAEKLLRPWVIRHLKPRHLPAPFTDIQRRRRLPGATISLAADPMDHAGLAVKGNSLLPFLLAARAASCNQNARPVFAEGLASSYEAFLETRRVHSNSAGGSATSLDTDDEDANTPITLNDTSQWYLAKLDELVPRGDKSASMSHPKIAATVSRALEIWKQGEKVVIFCHYIATGKTLRQRLSEAVNDHISLVGSKKLGCMPEEVPSELDRIGKRFFDEESPVRQACDEETNNLLKEYPSLNEHRVELLNIVRRYIRTPAFLVRFFPLQRGRLTKEHLQAAMESHDGSDFTLRELLQRFFTFLVERCGTVERQQFIAAVNSIQTGSYAGTDLMQAYSSDELQGAKPESLNPTVRLVNGTTKQLQRQKLMLAFNTPFYPEILVASSVMSEGVDLHLNCRYIIHHDLCWNPTTLEQRTGRIDRIGAKVEYCGQPIHVYLPYIAETQDEKMYRVVMDRERWFNVVMGEKLSFDLKTTEKLATRLPLPESVASELSFRLEVHWDSNKA